MPKVTAIEQLSYEQALAELEAIVNALETEPPSLEQALERYARGQALAQRCAVLLEQAELKVQQLAGADLVEFTPPD
jgi:exodeoxyribonuclease VII small subunit